VILYDDIGEAHADCDAPDAPPPAPMVDAGEGRMAQVYLLTGRPLQLEAVEEVPAP
jgi:hypothetical protein